MRFSENVVIGFRAMRANLLRSILTLSIIAIGIMALVGILTAIDSVSMSISDSFSGLGANSFTIQRKGADVRGRRRGQQAQIGSPVTFREAVEFKDAYDYPAKVSVSTVASATGVVKFADEKTNDDVTIIGGDDNYLDVNGYALEIGRGFSPTELDNGLQRALVGQDVVELLFEDKAEKALDAYISINNIKYKVVGVLATKGNSEDNSDRVVVVPLLTAKRYYGFDDKEYDIEVMAQSTARVDDAMAAATGVFRRVRKLRHAEADDFELKKSDSLVGIIQENTASLRYASIFIGLITLLGAAIGLMNIMLVSVTERTREIGICKAVGATRANIMTQYLTEAVLIGQAGGLVGIVLGILAGNAISLVTGGAFVVPWQWMLLGVVVCFITGLLSGLYPAYKAAGLDPIESLRYE
jgi:putative ABC transport system permease protein